VVVGDPALIVALAVAAARGAGRLGAGQGLGLDHSPARRLLAAGGGLGDAGLREERLDPGLVDEVESRAEDAGQEEVEEDAAVGKGEWLVVVGFVESCGWGRG